MQPSGAGFLYPYVTQKNCIKCGACSHVCPAIHKPQIAAVLEAYAAKHKNAAVKLKSSSGGMFTALAETVLKENAVVFGASFDAQWNVAHTFVENIADLDRLRRSKYVQSNVANAYAQAKTFLDKGRKVLFTGTPCQIAGLRNYLGKTYENLLTADIICHGVNSPAVWQLFLQQNTQKGKIASIDFRHKQFGWDTPLLQITYTDGSSSPHIPKLFHPLMKTKNGYLLRHHYRPAFGVCNLYERPACHACKFKGIDNRVSDFTLGDLWGNWPDIITPQDKKYGISVLLVNTPKAQKLLEKLPIEKTAVDPEQVARCNPMLVRSGQPHPKRAEFFARYRTEKLSKLVPELLGEKPILVRILQKLHLRIF